MNLAYWSYDKREDKVELIKYRENEEWWWTLVYVDRVDIQLAWIRYWGSFLSNLWYALSHADMNNAKKILDTRENYIIDYVNQGLLNYYEK